MNHKPDEEEKRWRIEDDLRTLERAQEIKGDAKRMKEVEACRNDKMRKLADIKVETAPKTMKKAK